MRSTSAILGVLGAVIATSTLGIVPAAAADMRPPELTQVYSEGNADAVGSLAIDVDATEGPVTERVGIQLSDESPIATSEVRATLCHNHLADTCLEPFTLTRTEPSGTFHGEAIFPQGAANGEWGLAVGPVSDAAGNTWPGGDLGGWSEGHVHVLGDRASFDTVRPVVEFTLAPTELFTHEGEDTVVVTARVREDRGELNRVEATFTSYRQPAVTLPMTRISGDDGDGIWQVRHTLPRDAMVLLPEYTVSAWDAQGLGGFTQRQEVTARWYRPTTVSAPVFTDLCGEAGQVRITDTKPDIRWTVSGPDVVRSSTDPQVYRVNSSGGVRVEAVRDSNKGQLLASPGAVTTEPGTQVFEANFEPNICPMKKPTTISIAGTARVGQKMTAQPGTWSPGTTFRYEWHRGAIVGAAQSYSPQPGDLGSDMYVTVIGSKAGYQTEQVTSRIVTIMPGLFQTPVPAVSLASGTLSTTGRFTPAPTTYTYQWLRNGAVVKGATGRTYKPSATTRAAAFQVKVTGRRAGYTTVTKASARHWGAPVVKLAKCSSSGTYGFAGTTRLQCRTSPTESTLRWR